MSTDFQTRLVNVMQAGNLRVADLARWFDRPDPTVRGWVHGVALGGAPLDAAYVTAMLVKLEKLAKRGNGALPVPRLSPSKRIAYLAGLRRDSKCVK